LYGVFPSSVFNGQAMLILSVRMRDLTMKKAKIQHGSTIGAPETIACLPPFFHILHHRSFPLQEVSWLTPNQPG
jgi:hypothetical protein